MKVWTNNKTYVHKCYYKNFTYQKTCVGLNTEYNNQTNYVETAKFLGLQIDSN